MAFAERFKAARLQAGLSQDKLAAVLEVSKRTLINYENGVTMPPIDKLPVIAKHFGVSIESLISEEEEFIASAYEKGGSKSAQEAAALVSEVTGLFAGGRLSEGEKENVMRAIQNAFWIAKDESKRKFTPKKYRETTQDE